MVLPLRSVTLVMSLRATMPSEPMPWSILKSWVVAMPLAFHTIQVSTVVAAHCRSPEAMAEVAVLLRDLLDRHVEAVGLVDAGLLGERDRREAGPAGDADGDLGVLRRGAAGEGRCRQRAAATAVNLDMMKLRLR